MNIEQLNNATLGLEGVIKDRLPDLSVCEFWILHELYHAPKQRVCGLAANRGRTFQTISRVCRNLESKGFIVIAVHDDDKRAREIDLTPTGRRAYFKAAGAVKKKLSTIHQEAS